EMRSQGIISGNPIVWPKVDQPKAWFYPILDTDGKSIRELWIYRVQGKQLQHIDQVAVRPMKESFITVPLVGTASQVASVDSNAAPASVRLMPGSSATAPWLLLEGQRRYGNTVMRYGQILSYQADSHRVHRLLNWSSSAGKPPHWQRSEGGDQQLIIDQTVGLRPSFLLYRLVKSDPPKLQEVSLYSSVYESDTANPVYEQALKLAQGAVWSHSLAMMQSAKKALGQDWSSQAEDQLMLIRLHAARTKSQTEQNWSSQQQHILAYLIDGQWDQALGALENKPAIYDSTLKRLDRDFDALWRGITTHLQVHPKDATTHIWGALMVTARRSPEAGEDWLKQKTRSKNTLKRWQALNQPNRNAVESGGEVVNGNPVAHVSTVAAPTTTSQGSYAGMVGQVRAIGTPGDGWLRSQTPSTLIPGQTWYHIEVQLLQDSSGWRSPTSINAASFWAESLSLRRQVQLFHNQRPVANMTIHGVKAYGTGMALLAVGPQVEAATLAANADGLQWLTTLSWQPPPMLPAVTSNLPDADSPSSEALNSEALNSGALNSGALDSDNPDENAIELSMAAAEPDTSIAATIGHQLGLTLEQTRQVYPHLRHATLDLLGDSTPEQLFSVHHELSPELALTPGKTMIFSTAGELLYSDVNQPQSLLALTAKSTEQPAKLLIEQAGRYTLIGL
ncbi:MAG: hypothetical protein AAGA46_13955, partial [Cyanobacteria bacterium P01_F01_bin.13]